MHSMMLSIGFVGSSIAMAHGQHIDLDYKCKIQNGFRVYDEVKLDIGVLCSPK